MLSSSNISNWQVLSVSRELVNEVVKYLKHQAIVRLEENIKAIAATANGHKLSSESVAKIIQEISSKNWKDIFESIKGSKGAMSADETNLPQIVAQFIPNYF